MQYNYPVTRPLPLQLSSHTQNEVGSLGGAAKKNLSKKYCQGLSKNKWVNFVKQWAVNNSTTYALAISNPLCRSQYYEFVGKPVPLETKKRPFHCPGPADGPGERKVEILRSLPPPSSASSRGSKKRPREGESVQQETKAKKISKKTQQALLRELGLLPQVSA